MVAKEPELTISHLRPDGSRATDEVILSDRYDLERGRVFLSGIQSLVRLPVDQARRDRASGLKIGTFITGYPGSPLGGYDLALQQNRTLLDAHGIIHRPGENEELAATSLMGTQLIDRYPHSAYDGVVGLWYGKGPGLDRSGDALRHGNFAGTSKSGAVVVLSGEDHEAKSSTLPYEQEYYFAHSGIPVLYPSTVEEFLTYGLHAIAMSRFSGCWVALKLIGQLCDGGQTVDVDPDRTRIVVPQFEVNGEPFEKTQDNLFFPGKTIETERRLFEERQPAALEYVRANGIDRIVTHTSSDQIALLTAGKSYADTRQALTDLGIDEDDLRAAGVRLIKLGAIYPIDERFVRDAVTGLREIFVVEEKRGTLEEKVRSALCNLAQHPAVYGKRDRAGAEMFPAYGSMDSDVIARRLGPLLRERVRQTITLTEHLSALDEIAGRDYDEIVTRTPNYCSGCPHSVSTTVLDDQVAWGAPGCHVFAAIMDDQPQRQIDATFQLGGEGVGWIGLSPFTDLTHIFQNQGDGSLFHSSYLNIRFSVAAGVNMTYKILFNGYVANTGAQEPVGVKKIPELVQMLALEGVTKIAIVAADKTEYRGVKLPSIATVHESGDIDSVTADLAATPGVTIFLYDGECANERRRRRKRGIAPKDNKYVVINEDVCENCGDCGSASNCMSLQKTDTEFGPKTQIHQSSCNQDHSCLKGDCPSFLTVYSEAGLAKPTPPPLDADELAEPHVVPIDRPFHIYIPGVGGTGVLTLNSVLAWAAHIDGLDVTTYDQTGAAQKWGSVLSSLAVAPIGMRTPGNKVGAGQADLYLATDAMGGASDVNLDRCARERTAAVINTHVLPSGEMVRNVHFAAPVEPMAAKIALHTDPSRTISIDAHSLAESLFGDYMATNMIAVGAAYQAGFLPISSVAIEQAIVLNGTAVAQNQQAFRYGRVAFSDPGRIERITAAPKEDVESAVAKSRSELKPDERAAYDAMFARCDELPDSERRLMAVRIAELIGYQDVKYASEYAHFVLMVAAEERARLGVTRRLPITREVLKNLYKLMAYKDEYEVARLHLRTAREQKVAGKFADKPTIKYNLHPPILRSMGMKDKIELSEWWFNPVFGALKSMRRLRGSRLDPFGWDRVRKVERQLVSWYRSVIEQCMSELSMTNRPVVLDIARVPDMIRGYEKVKLGSVDAAKTRAEVLQGQLHGFSLLPIVNTEKER